MSLYESVVIIRQEATPQQVEGLADLFEEVITKNNGKLIKRENWGLRSLAYKIKKNRKGHYILFNLDVEPSVIQEMERQMRLNEDVLRYLTIRIDEIEEGPSIPVQMQSRSDQTVNNFDSGTSENDIVENVNSEPSAESPSEVQDDHATEQAGDE